MMAEAQTKLKNEQRKALNTTAARHKIVMDFSVAPSSDDIAALALEALEFLPFEFKKYLGDFDITVEDFPDMDVEEELDLESPYDQLAYYKSLNTTSNLQGVSTLSKGDDDILILYRRSILDLWCESEQDIKELIRGVIFQELGHHCGFEEDEIDRMIDESF